MRMARYVYSVYIVCSHGKQNTYIRRDERKRVCVMHVDRSRDRDWRSLGNGCLRKGRSALTSSSHSQSLHLANQPIHAFLHGAELVHPTLLALDVLTQRTQRREMGPAACQRANIDLVLVSGARQVRVQRRQRPERAVAQITLIRSPVPCPRRRDVRRARYARASDHTRRVCDEVLSVVLAHKHFDLLPRHSRRALPRLQVQHNRGPGHKA
ncbi:unnamed protein product [Mycena citricolor]|uniref:Uncharacterized protein n=1 Tax=Mycena citricolor TaxID=2018698 RepID=A0AAD2GTT8_9AGAR|nr:unnamed protein product [Mycena citricolor]